MKGVGSGDGFNVAYIVSGVCIVRLPRDCMSVPFMSSRFSKAQVHERHVAG